MTENKTNLTQYVMYRANALDSKFKGTKSDFRFLIRFMDVNQWYGFSHRVEGIDAEVLDFPAQFPPLDLWLKAYRKTDDEKYSLLVENMSEKCGSLISEWETFRCRETDMTSLHALNCLDFLLSHDHDLSWDPDAVETLLVEAAEVLPRKSVAFLIRFCERQMDACETSENAKCTFRLAPSENSRGTSAIPFSDFSSLAWMVFDRDAIVSGHYIEKAAQKRLYAEVWFMTAMHFVSALRIPDIRMLPVPQTSLTGDELKEKTLNGDMSIREYTELVNKWLYIIELEGAKPTKTLGTSGVTRVVVSIPTTLFTVFGQMLSILLSYHKEGEPLVLSTYISGFSLENFFGAEFNRLCGCQYFLSTRRLNKAYLQGVEYLAERSNEIHVRGYLISSLLRSHKIPRNNLSQTTDAYLRDGDFVSISPQTVAYEMFERGIFGFIPVLLLSHYDSEWHSLSLHDQTTVIQSLDLTPVQLERMTEALGVARKKAQELLAQVLANSDAANDATWLSSQIEQMLCRIASGAAPGKNIGNQCLRSAAGMSCCDPYRASCIGCGYELWTRTGVHILMEEYEKNLRAMRSSSGLVERLRLEKLNNSYILPALQSILVSIRTLYNNGEETAKGLEEMIKWRFEHAKE